MISYNEKHFTENGKPWFPIMGEYEYSRTERGEWERGIAKMKALGLNAVQSYAIWLHHEEIRGHFDFRGNRNLRAFIRLIKEAGMKMCLRVGPWVHAELRAGGFPDWIFERPYTPRTDDPEYLADVERYFKELYKQCEGYFDKDGGPIFAIQVENELKPSAELSRERGERYVNALIEMLKKIGFDVPVFFATGWGNAITGDAIPVWGEYAAAPWEQHTDPLPPNEAYLIGNNPNEAAVGEYTERPAGVGENSGARKNVPYMTIEQGTGNQPTRLRRPVVSAEDNGAMTFCRLAQGLVGLGYYVFHGGINNVGALSSTNEYRDESLAGKRGGYFCDLAERNYDFQAPVSQYNRISRAGREMKIWNSLASEFSDFLCRADAELPENRARQADDFVSPRRSLRRLGKGGMLFCNNYVTRRVMPRAEIKGFVFEAEGEKIALPNAVLENGEYAAFPFNLSFGNTTLKYALATPLCTLNGNTAVLFSESGRADYSAEGDGNVIVISRREAQNSFKIINGDKEYLVITEAELYREGKTLKIEYTADPVLKIYPKPREICGYSLVEDEGDFALFKKLEYSTCSVGAAVGAEVSTGEYKEYRIKLSYGEQRPYDVYLSLTFSADLAEIFIDGEKVNDMLYTGEPFELSMRYHYFPSELTVRLYPLKEGDSVYLEKRPLYVGGFACSLDGIKLEALSLDTLEIVN